MCKWLQSIAYDDNERIITTTFQVVSIPYKEIVGGHMEQWFEFKDRKGGLAAALTRHPPTRLRTGYLTHLNQSFLGLLTLSWWAYQVLRTQAPIPMRDGVGG